MANFQINILGCGSATPSLRHLPSSQVVDFRDRLMMIDCGEGAQLSMRRMKLKYSRLTNIFISHLHGDHCLGLPGLLSTLSLHQMEGRVTVHVFEEGARMFKEIIDFFCRERSYELEFNVIRPRCEIIYEDRGLTVETFPLFHRVACTGFIFREKPKLRNIRRDMIDFYEIPISQRQNIKMGADYIRDDGSIISNEWLTTPPPPSLSYAYCSDTLYDQRVAEAVRGVDVIYHEATYTEESRDKAHSRGHSTAAEAAKIAAEAGAKQLILGHYSKSYINEDNHLKEAMEIFPNVVLADEGLKIDLI